MKKLILVLLVVIVAIVAALQNGYAQTQVASFRIVVEGTATGLKATCLGGCAWTDVTYTCGTNAKQSCKAEIDEKGIGGVK